MIKIQNSKQDRMIKNHASKYMFGICFIGFFEFISYFDIRISDLI